MIPYKDNNPTETVPFVTVGLIALNILIFLWTFLSPRETAESIVYSYGAMPANLLTFKGDQPIHPIATVLTSMFLHGGFFHVGGNMLYLWIFGNNIEDKLGHIRFIIFYILGGVFAAYAHSITEPISTTPMIGASGAVSAVLGAYLLLFPHARVYTLIFFGFFYQILKVPALIVIGFWAIIQLVNGLISGAGGGGIAWFAHIGGFAFGLITIKIFMPKRRPRSGSSMP